MNSEQPRKERMNSQRRMTVAERVAENLDELEYYTAKAWTPTNNNFPIPQIRVYLTYEREDIGHIVIDSLGDLRLSKLDEAHRFLIDEGPYT